MFFEKERTKKPYNALYVLSFFSSIFRFCLSACFYCCCDRFSLGPLDVRTHFRPKNRSVIAGFCFFSIYLSHTHKESYPGFFFMNQYICVCGLPTHFYLLENTCLLSSSLFLVEFRRTLLPTCGFPFFPLLSAISHGRNRE